MSEPNLKYILATVQSQRNQALDTVAALNAKNTEQSERIAELEKILTDRPKQGRRGKTP